MKEILSQLKREKDSHKGQNGKVAIIAGSKDYTGAPALAAMAAYRSGADLVKIFTSEKIADTVSSYSENFIVSTYSGDYFTQEDVEKATELLEWADSGVIGPGMSKPQEKAIKNLLENTETSLIIDADAIRPAVNADIKKAVLTPHKNEKKHIEEKFGSVEEFASPDKVVAVKGKEDLVYQGEKVYKNDTGNPSMTVGGTGDMLTGVIAALISQDMSLPDASWIGVFATGKAGEIAAEKYGYGALPTDMIDYLPRVLFK